MENKRPATEEQDSTCMEKCWKNLRSKDGVRCVHSLAMLRDETEWPLTEDEEIELANCKYQLLLKADSDGVRLNVGPIYKETEICFLARWWHEIQQSVDCSKCQMSNYLACKLHAYGLVCLNEQCLKFCKPQINHYWDDSGEIKYDDQFPTPPAFKLTGNLELVDAFDNKDNGLRVTQTLDNKGLIIVLVKGDEDFDKYVTDAERKYHDILVIHTEKDQVTRMVQNGLGYLI